VADQRCLDLPDVGDLEMIASTASSLSPFRVEDLAA
jgi:hypothetical protein